MKVLIISQNEICHNPRLAKAGDFLASKGCRITVLNPIVGVASRETYNNFVADRKWTFIEIKLDKLSLKSKVKWLVVSLLNYACTFVWKHLRFKIGFPYVLCKNVILTSSLIKTNNYDIILTNLLELLPFAVKLKRKANIPTMIFDSQEYFKGQYSKYEEYKFDWIVEAEKKYIKYADIILATTSVMQEKLTQEYGSRKTVIRVRNLPPQNLRIIKHREEEASTLKLVWHGMSINYGNCRGVHILVDAIAKCQTDVHLFLQGKLSNKDSKAFGQRINELGIKHKVTFLPPAKPDDIINSISKYDIGLAGEIPEEENQLLTSSNKLFDYIAAGLVTVVPNLPGIKETVENYETGLLFEPGNSSQIASIVDELNFDRDMLRRFKQNSSDAFNKGLYWENDYELVWQKIANREEHINNLSPLGSI